MKLFLTIILIFSFGTIKASDSTDVFNLNLEGRWFELRKSDCQTTMIFDYPDKIYFLIDGSETSGTYKLIKKDHREEVTFELSYEITHTSKTEACGKLNVFDFGSQYLELKLIGAEILDIEGAEFKRVK